MSTPAEAGVEFLERLLALSERSPDRTRPASMAPDYDGLRSAESLSRFDGQMRTAERAGAVSIRNGKRERRHLIERITVTNAEALARHLGRDPASSTARQARSVLEPIVAGAPGWVGNILDQIEERWARREAAFRIQPGDTILAQEFLRLLMAISRDEARGLDARTFSLRATGDTKAFDRNASRIAAAAAPHPGESPTNFEAIWQRLGLERFAHPVHLRGPLLVQDQERILVDARVRPFASVHPELLTGLRLTAQPSFLLTIENFASFNRYVREIEDGSLVIYTGGFPSKAILDAIGALLKLLDDTVPYFHWGDIDPGGVRIFRFLEENAARRPLPHMMERQLADARGKPAEADPSLASIARSDSDLAALAEWLSRGPDVKYLEQEALDPSSPITGIPVPSAASL